MILQVASVPFGAVVGILGYIEKRRKSKKVSSCQQRSSITGSSHQAAPFHQTMPHPSVYSPLEPVSRSSAPTPAPSAAYMTQPFQQMEPQFPVIGSQVQVQRDIATPTPYSMPSRYPPPQTSQMQPQVFDHLPPPPPAPQPSQFSVSPYEQQQRSQPLYTQSKQLQQVNGACGTPHQLQQRVTPSSLPQNYQQQPSQYQQPHPQPHPQQQQVQAGEPQQHSPVVSLPHSSSTGSNGGGVATSPTTAQRVVSLPTSVSPCSRGECVYRR